MGKLTFLLLANSWHSNVPSNHRRQYLQQFGDWMHVFAQASIPITLGLQRIDLELAGWEEGQITSQGIGLLSGLYSHILPSMYIRHKRFKRHARWTSHEGRVSGNQTGVFVPEFELPDIDFLLPGKMFIPIQASPLSIWYSVCQTGDITPHPIADHQAISFLDKVVVPMAGVSDILKRFFMFQRYPTDDNRRAMLEEIKATANANPDRTLVLFIDLEAPLVGSYHGLRIWEWFFDAIRSDPEVRKLFVNWETACQHWDQNTTPEPSRDAIRGIGRNIGVKWTKWPVQLRHNDRVKECRMSRNEFADFENRWLALFTHSDFLSAWDSKISGGITLDADLGELHISFDQGIIDVSLAALRAWEYNELPYSALRDLAGILKRDVSDDTQWFANRCADLLQQHQPADYTL